MPPEPLSREHTCRKVQCLPGISHQELCRALHRQAKSGRLPKNIAEIKEILKGNTQEIERMLFQQMQELAAEMKFEEAQKIKEKYLLLENYRAKSEVVSNVLHNIDVFSIEEDSDEKSAFVNYLHITNGAINQAFTFEYKSG